MIDFFDPNNWLTPEPWEWRLYLDDTASIYALVDEIDWRWAINWRWNVKRCKRLKEYARRAVSTYNEDKTRKGARSIYLSVEIMKRTGIVPPSSAHTIVDHRNGKSLDCRRHNLRYYTVGQNNRNRFGSHATELFDALCT